MTEPLTETDYRLTDEEIDLLTEPVRKNVVQGTSGRWIINAPLLDVVTALGEACERIIAARQAQVWDECTDAHHHAAVAQGLAFTHPANPYRDVVLPPGETT